MKISGTSNDATLVPVGISAVNTLVRSAGIKAGQSLRGTSVAPNAANICAPVCLTTRFVLSKLCKN